MNHNLTYQYSLAENTKCRYISWGMEYFHKIRPHRTHRKYFGFAMLNSDSTRWLSAVTSMNGLPWCFVLTGQSWSNQTNFDSYRHKHISHLSNNSLLRSSRLLHCSRPASMWHITTCKNTCIVFSFRILTGLCRNFPTQPFDSALHKVCHYLSCPKYLRFTFSTDPICVWGTLITQPSP